MPQQTARESTDHLCPACGCLCDDLQVVFADDRVVEVGRGCPQGVEWFREVSGNSSSACEVAGESVSRDDAIRAITDHLRNSRRPAVVGLVNATIETQKVAAALAECTRSLVHVGLASARYDAAELLARQAVGKVGATWGEVRRRADLIVCLGRPLVETHPRLVERYLPPWVGSAKCAGAAWNDVGPGYWIGPDGSASPDLPSQAPSDEQHLRFRANREIVFLSALATIMAGNKLDGERAEERTGVSLQAIDELSGRLQNARYAAWIVGEGFPGGPDTVGAWELLYDLVNRLNVGHRRCVIVKAGGPGNASGAEVVVGWRTGFGQAIDFAAGDPRYRPGEWTLEGLFRGQAADLVVGIGDPPSASGFPTGLPKPSVPVVWLRPACPVSEPAAGFAADVQITTATPGWDESGTFVRSDGQPVAVRRVVDPTLPTAVEIIQELVDRLKEGS